MSYTLSIWLNKIHRDGVAQLVQLGLIEGTLGKAQINIVIMKIAKNKNQMIL